VRQVAEMANALQFIESNIEDLEKDEVKQEVEKKFRELVNLDKNRMQFTNILKLESLYGEKQLDLEEI
jgi:hypothetical protein